MNLPTKIYKCMQQESSQSFCTMQRNDVVCARGRTYFDHKGNQQFRKLITFSKDAYSKQTSRSGKSQIVSNIIDTVFGNSGRFIKQNGTRKRWIECKCKRIVLYCKRSCQRITVDRRKDNNTLIDDRRIIII